MSLIPLGKIVRLQIQRAALKIGEKPNRIYDPSGILSVDELTLTPRGALVRLPDGGTLLDIHNADHPQTRNNDGTNALSVGFTSHYAAMRAEYGDRLTFGCAGENIIVEAPDLVSQEMLGEGLVIQSGDNLIRLTIVSHAPPCRPFSGYVMGGTEASVKETLQFLDHGMRGFYGALASVSPVTIAVGDRVLLPQS